ncbi:hypothetical protein BT96DRAFT_613561 [Gymnopus androsaceus JB14]|uniref:Uncharacterized protein n=1 Tax=Gymnopus androsaceus JB14 TaxID=1447944 RepID=A0A6A4GI25_9AGAR|nr:hypothetical protein BT96DRAFT_613561 [Gymnopus androsaceus JB14]
MQETTGWAKWTMDSGGLQRTEDKDISRRSEEDPSRFRGESSCRWIQVLSWYQSYIQTGIAAIKIPWQRQAEITGPQVPYAGGSIAEPLVGDVRDDAGDASMSRGTSFRANASNPDSWSIDNGNTNVHDNTSYSQSERQAERGAGTNDLSSPSTLTGIPTLRPHSFQSQLVEDQQRWHCCSELWPN